MGIVFNVLLHLLLVGSLLLFLGGVIMASINERDPRERILRIAALAVGAMVALGAQESGVSYASFTVQALSGARTASAAASVGAAIIPALLGAGLGFYIVRVFRRSNRIATRILGFIAMLAGTAFAAIYAQATQTKGVFLGTAAIPNVAFVSGVILTIVFTYDPDDVERGSTMGMLADALRRRNGKQAAPSPAAAFGPGQSAAPQAPRHDPFG
jgi:hypothetical protein